jgi:uncharacterized repeat protein (TIGR02543 family)
MKMTKKLHSKQIINASLSLIITFTLTLSLMTIGMFSSVSESGMKKAYAEQSAVSTLVSASSLKQGDIVYFGRYPKTDLGTLKPKTGKLGVDWAPQALWGYYGDTSSSITHYYKMEPIAWKVLSNSNNRLFLTSINLLDNFPFLVGHIGSTVSTPGAAWKYSSMRSWLNGYSASFNVEGGTGVDYNKGNSFIVKAFSTSESSLVAAANLAVNFDTAPFSAEEGTSDKVFLLSYDEILDSTLGFNPDPDAEDVARKIKNTAYAAARGSGRGVSMNETNQYYGPWWLRTRGSAIAIDASAVNKEGKFAGYSRSGAYGDHRGVRPALYLNTSSSALSVEAIAGQSNAYNIFAKQKNENVKVKFIANGGTIGKAKAKTKTVTIKGGKSIGKLPFAKRVNHKFKGWYTNKSGGKKITSKTKVTKTTKVYAHWKKLAKYGKVVKVTALYIRNAPIAHSNATTVIGHMKTGQTFKIRAYHKGKVKNNNWYKLIYKGKVAYVYAKYVRVVYK